VYLGWKLDMVSSGSGGGSCTLAGPGMIRAGTVLAA
jgi:hypothetical protein